jgi:hypothetical protein
MSEYREGTRKSCADLKSRVCARVCSQRTLLLGAGATAIGPRPRAIAPTEDGRPRVIVAVEVEVGTAPEPTALEWELECDDANAAEGWLTARVGFAGCS